MILGLGTDLVDVRRIEKALARFGRRFAERVFTATELAYADQRGESQKAAILAKRFAAKEACVKALGTGFGAHAGWRDIGVVNAANGLPTLHLTGEAAKTLAQMTPEGMLAVIHLSMSDEPPIAQAVVVISFMPHCS